MKCEFQRVIARFFRDESRLIAKWPLFFLAIPLLLAGALAYGIYKHRHHFNAGLTDQLRMFMPNNLPSAEQHTKVQEYFPVTNAWRESYNLFDDGVACHVTIVDESAARNVLRDEILSVAGDIFRRVTNLTARVDGITLHWRQLCYQIDGVCAQHPLFSLTDDRIAFGAILRSMTYPYMDVGGDQIDNSFIFGGVTLRANSTIEKAEALRIPFFLDSSVEPPGRQFFNIAWQQEFVKLTKQLWYPQLRIYYMTSVAWAVEIDRNGEQLIPCLPILVAVLVLFAVCATCASDWVLSKPLLGFCGVCNAAFAVIAAVGTLFLCGYPFLYMVLIMPFLVLSISVDNMFILIGSWRNTTPGDSVEDRMAVAVGNTAVSMTITALTDGISFSVGSISQFPAVRIFCTYCALAILYSFLYQMTFFLACMALSGRREAANRHCLTLRKVLPRSLSVDKSCGYNLCCAGGYVYHSSTTFASTLRHRVRIPTNFMSEVLSTEYADLLSHAFIKAVVVVLYVGYLGTAIWGIMEARLGLDTKHLVPYSSHIASALDADDRYFNAYGPYACGVLEGESDYHKLDYRVKLKTLYQSLTNTPYTTAGDFWLLDFETYINSSTFPSSFAFKQALIRFLRHEKYRRHEANIRWQGGSAESMQLVATRMSIRLRYAGTSNISDIAKTLKRIYADSDVNGFIYASMFYLVDQQEQTVINLVQEVAVAVVIMVIISAVFIPRLLCVLWIAIAILSINTGVIGYLCLWGVDLDIISTITIVMSIGFSVDYVAHVTYHYMACQPNQKRIHHTMRNVGLPILQSAMSTVLGIATLSLVDAYMVRTFVKTVVLVIGIGILHSLLFLPVAYSIVIAEGQFLDVAGHYGRVREYLTTNIPKYLGRHTIRNLRMAAYFLRPPASSHATTTASHAALFHHNSPSAHSSSSGSTEHVRRMCPDVTNDDRMRDVRRSVRSNGRECAGNFILRKPDMMHEDLATCSPLQHRKRRASRQPSAIANAELKAQINDLYDFLKAKVAQRFLVNDDPIYAEPPQNYAQEERMFARASCRHTSNRRSVRHCRSCSCSSRHRPHNRRHPPDNGEGTRDLFDISFREGWQSLGQPSLSSLSRHDRGKSASPTSKRKRQASLPQRTPTPPRPPAKPARFRRDENGFAKSSSAHGSASQLQQELSEAERQNSDHVQRCLPQDLRDSIRRFAKPSEEPPLPPSATQMRAITHSHDCVSAPKVRPIPQRLAVPTSELVEIVVTGPLSSRNTLRQKAASLAQLYQSEESIADSDLFGVVGGGAPSRTPHATIKRDSSDTDDSRTRLSTFKGTSTSATNLLTLSQTTSRLSDQLDRD